MRSWRAFVAALVVCVALSGCTAGGEAFVVEAPAWKAGYTWAFDTTWETSWQSTENGVTDNGTYNDQEHAVVTILNSTYQQDGERYYIGVAVRDGREVVVAYRAADLAPMWVAWDYDRRCVQGACTNVLTGIEVEDEDDPTFLDFPLRRGKTWGEVFEEGDDEFTLEWLISNRVLGRKVVETPVGSTSTIHVRQTVGLQNQEAVEEMFKQMMAAEGITVDLFQLTFSIRVDTYYSEEHLIPVRTTHTDEGHLLVRGREGNEPFEWQERWQEVGEEVLSGSSLVAQPEVPLADIGPYLFGGQPLPDPTGEAGAAVGYALSIDAVRADAFEGEALEFRAVVDGEMPADHVVQWRLLDWRGITAAEGTGLTFQPSLDVAGAYKVVATSGAQKASAKATADARVHLDAVYDVACGPVEVAGSTLAGDCDNLLLPIFPGIEHVTISVAPTSQADAVNRGAIHLIDPAGGRIIAGGDGRSLMVDDFSGYWVGDELWTMDYVRQVGITEQLEVHVQVAYGDYLGAATVEGGGGFGLRETGSRLGTIFL